MFRRRRFERKLPSFLSFFIIVFILFLIIEIFLYAEKSLRPAILSIAELKADILATEAINRALLDNITSDLVYADLIKVERDESGRIVMANLDGIKINKLLAKTTLATQEALYAMEQEPFEIPLGEAMDSYILATYGPQIPVRLIPRGRVNTRIVDVFEEAGINQVRHKIYMEVFTEVRIVIPFISSPVEVLTTVPIADTIYPGEVPDTVINLRFPSESTTIDLP